MNVGVSILSGVLDYFSVLGIGMLIRLGFSTVKTQPDFPIFALVDFQKICQKISVGILELFGLIAVVAGLLSLGCKIFNQWFSIKSINSAATALNGILITRMINPSNFIKVNQGSSDAGAFMLYETNRVHSFLTSLSQIFANSVLLIFVAASVCVFLSKGVLFLLAGMFVFYMLCVKMCKSFMLQSGQSMAEDEKQILKTATFIGRNLREILVENMGETVKKQFQYKFLSIKNILGKVQIVTLLPSRAGELLLLVFISWAVTLSSPEISKTSGILNELLLLVIAAQKILPSTQQVFSYWASLQGSLAGLVRAIGLLTEPLPTLSEGKVVLPFKTLVMKGVYYRFPGAQTWSVADMNIKIKKGEKIGITGPSGAGKSTFLDLVSLLLSPQAGKILINGVDSARVSHKGWWSKLSYIPQDVLLVGETVLEAVTGQKNPGPRLVEEARKSLQQVGWEFPRRSSENWGPRKIGEFGSCLSGGQRRKIAAARSLFSKKEVILLDEVTASLDEASEKALLRGFLGKRNTTVILVSHQASTLKQCERIVRLSVAGHLKN